MDATTPIDKQVEELVFAGLVELGIERDEIGYDVGFEELDVDSLDLVELRQMIEEKFAVEIVKDDLVNLRTVGDVIALVVSRAA